MLREEMREKQEVEIGTICRLERGILALWMNAQFIIATGIGLERRVPVPTTQVPAWSPTVYGKP